MEEIIRRRGRPRREPDIKKKRIPKPLIEEAEEKTLKGKYDKKIPDWHGRRYIFKTPQQLERRIDEYFKKAPITVVKINGIPQERVIYTISGLKLSVGLDKETFEHYMKLDGFRQVLERAMLAVADCYEQQLHSDKPSGAVFALGNMGWSNGKNKEIQVSLNPFIQIMQKRARLKEGIEDAEIVEIEEGDNQLELPEHEEGEG